MNTWIYFITIAQPLNRAEIEAGSEFASAAALLTTVAGGMEKANLDAVIQLIACNGDGGDIRLLDRISVGSAGRVRRGF